MAENKEITTLHPYMNRNKNRYPNVKDENIPDTIQRKLTAGTGISISPENVISATGGDSYTRSETDALLDTKADKTALDNAEQIIPTDIAVKDGKLGLEHNTTWLTNQNAINLGDGLTYDEATKTLKASGVDNSAIKTITLSSKYNNSDNYIYITDAESDFIKNNFPVNVIVKFSNGTNILLTPAYFAMLGGEPYINFIINDDTPVTKDKITQVKMCFISYYDYPKRISIKNPEIIELDDSLEKKRTNSTTVGTYQWGESTLYKIKVTNPLPKVPIDKTDSYYLEGTYDATRSTSAIKWSALKKTYNHYIVITDGTASNAIYLLIPSTNNLICNILTDLDTLLGTEPRFIQASGVVTDTASKLPIVAIKWQGSYSSSKIVTTSSEESATKFTDITDVVEPA